METKRKSNKSNQPLLPFIIVQKASSGNPEAINKVLKHYEPYICKLSLRLVYDEFGNAYMMVDEYMRRCLETKLITQILNFKVA